MQKIKNENIIFYKINMIIKHLQKLHIKNNILNIKIFFKKNKIFQNNARLQRLATNKQTKQKLETKTKGGIISGSIVQLFHLLISIKNCINILQYKEILL